ncbi:MAG: Undecaprenyl-phosphate galactose phosphotransferase [Bryobacterales bacterium]|nr:Undecaprenyl-phosphate galactose phosphotransferase [Bryobacterales bacterium]
MPEKRCASALTELRKLAPDDVSPTAGGVMFPELRRTVTGPYSSAVEHWMRRALSLTVALILLIVLAPLFFIIWAIIRLDSPGPAIYMQERVGSRRRKSGKRGTVWELRTFIFLKFRSMRQDADPFIHKEYIRRFCNEKLHAGESPEPAFKLQNDNRVTRVGRFLRRTSLDELPQLINVVKGDMSLVGPRPLPPYEVAHYREEHYQRFASLCGITGLWQVRGRGRVGFEEMIRMDTEFTRRASLWLDVKILLATIPAVLFGHGAR